MEKANFGRLVSFIFGIANDCLVDVYDVGDYRKIFLPMIVLRRFDAVLEPALVFNATYTPPVAARTARPGRTAYTAPSADTPLMVAEDTVPYG